jgi:hypothetical protein
MARSHSLSLLLTLLWCPLPRHHSGAASIAQFVLTKGTRRCVAKKMVARSEVLMTRLTHVHTRPYSDVDDDDDDVSSSQTPWCWLTSSDLSNIYIPELIPCFRIQLPTLSDTVTVFFCFSSRCF